MKTLYAVAKHLDESPSLKKALRQPKLFWQVEIEWADGLWMAFLSEKPTLQNLRLIWEAEKIEASQQHSGMEESNDKDVWQQRFMAARLLLTSFEKEKQLHSFHHAGPMPTAVDKALGIGGTAYDFDITVIEEVLH